MNLLDNQSKAEEIDRMYMDLEDMLLQNIIKHLTDYKQPIDTDRWLMQKLAEIGKLNAENIKLIRKQAGMTDSMIEEALRKSAEEAIDAIDPGLRKLAKKGLVKKGVKADKSENVQRVMETILAQSKDIFNKTNTVMSYMAKDAYTKLVYDINFTAKEIANKLSFLKDLGDEATAAVIGAKSRQEAMVSCIKRFSQRGIPAFIDKAGREWTPEAYVNMNIRNTIKNTAEEVQTARCKDFGVNLISIDSHSGARPKCAKDQGKIFDLNNGSGEVEDATGKKIKYYPWNSSSYGEPDGILGINCRHHKHPFIPGVNIHRYFPTEDIDANNRLYKQTQKQRQLEREVRKQKRECMLAKGLADQQELEAMAIKLKAKEDRLKNYVDSHAKLDRRRDRERVVGYDRDVSAKVNGINRRKKSLKNKSNSGPPIYSRSRDIEQYNRYKSVLGEMVGTIEEFIDIKYNNEKDYGALKHHYRIVNQYECNSGYMKPERIVELHDEAVRQKAKFSRKARKKGNMGIMELDWEVFLANSQLTDKGPIYQNFKGDKKKLILYPDNPEFTPTVVGGFLRKDDSEYKFFEYAAKIASDGRPHTLEILSEKAMCASCLKVMRQFQQRYPNVEVIAVSHKSEKAKMNHNRNPVFEYDSNKQFEKENIVNEKF